MLTVEAKHMSRQAKTGGTIQVDRIGKLLDVLMQLEVLHENYYGTVRDKSDDNGAKLFSYYLGKHYRQFCSILSEFSERKMARIRRKELRPAMEIVSADWLSLPEMPPAEVKGKALLDMAIRYNRRLTSLYRKLLSRPMAKDATLLVSLLLQLENRDADTFRKMVAMHYY